MEKAKILDEILKSQYATDMIRETWVKIAKNELYDDDKLYGFETGKYPGSKRTLVENAVYSFIFESNEEEQSPAYVKYLLEAIESEVDNEKPYRWREVRSNIGRSGKIEIHVSLDDIIDDFYEQELKGQVKALSDDAIEEIVDGYITGI